MPAGQNRVSSMASFRRGDCPQDGGFLQIRLLAGLYAQASIQTVLVVQSVADVLQNEPGDGPCDRPSSMPGGRYRILAGQISGGQSVGNLPVEIRVAASQNCLDPFLRNQVLDGIPLRWVAQGGWGDRCQIAF